jgi:hypothetical protein
MGKTMNDNASTNIETFKRQATMKLAEHLGQLCVVRHGQHQRR